MSADQVPPTEIQSEILATDNKGTGPGLPLDAWRLPAWLILGPVFAKKHSSLTAPGGV